MKVAILAADADKILLEGRRIIEAVRFENNPEPDHIGAGPEHLTH